MKRLLLGLVIVCLGSLYVAAQTEVSIKLHNSTDQSFTISDYGKIYFENGYLYISEGTGTPYSFEIANIQKMTFSHTVDIEDIATADMKIYPNPANGYIKIEGKNFDNHYQIYSMDGSLVLSGRSNNGESIDITSLRKGLYLINVDGQTFKITKL